MLSPMRVPHVRQPYRLTWGYSLPKLEGRPLGYFHRHSGSLVSSCLPKFGLGFNSFPERHMTAVNRIVYAARLSLGLPLALLATGCALSPTGTPSPNAGLAIRGSVHGGQQPISGANVYLFAANTTGYGNASVSLLTSGMNTSLDSSGGVTNGDYYVTTDANGNFSITGEYSCTPNTQVYLYALGGNPGLTAGSNNPAAGLLAALGNCPSTGNFLAATPYVVINEVSTVATAYAFAGFATDAVHVSSSGTALAQVGIANAFANAANLETLSTGVALATTPAGNGTVPQSTINTLANILAACVNSTGAVAGPTNPSACYTLFNNAESGGSTGTVPTDTATAAINIAHNPGTNIAALYALPVATPPFAPSLTTQPNDFTVALSVSLPRLDFCFSNSPSNIAIDGGGNVWLSCVASILELSSSGAAVSLGYSPPASDESLSIDRLGDVWVGSGYNLSAVFELSNTDSLISPSSGYTGGSIYDPNGIAIDGKGDAWIAAGNDGGGYGGITEITNAGVIVSPSGGSTSPSGGYAGACGSAIAIDGSNNVWVGGGDCVGKLSSAGVAISPPGGYTGRGIGYAGGANEVVSIAVDSIGNVWTANYGTGNVSELSNSGVALSPSIGYMGGGVGAPLGIAVDGAGNVWTAEGACVAELSNSGVAISPSNGYGYREYLRPAGGIAIGIAIDGSGNVWVQNLINGDQIYDVIEFIGVATPVITPIAAGLPATPTANGSSNLGTRP
jgi:hypothetical protein